MLNAFDLFFFQNTPHFHLFFLKILTLCADPKIMLLFFGLLSFVLLLKDKISGVLSKPFYFFVLTNLVMLCCGILKILCGRARPLLMDENIVGFTFFTVKHAFLSFPSSHAAIAAAFAHTLHNLFGFSRLIFFYPIVIMVTRLSLREHFATDVFAGFAIGIFISTLLSSISHKKYYLHKKN